MCGIFAIAGGRWRDAGLTARALGELRHRGPDGQGDLRLAAGGDSNGGWGGFLGHRRLSIIDLEGGRQPIANEDGRVAIVCNGEIYNYRELRAWLLERGHRFSTQSDSEVVLHLYEELGEACLGRLRGMFAFAILDSRRERPRLFAARDHLGQKPLYYRFDSATGELALASELKALLPLAPSIEPDPAALAQYLTLRLIAPPLSAFKGLAKLPPAHALSFEPGSPPKIERYWDLSYAPKLKGSEDELLDALEEKAIQAVKLCTVSDVRVGAFLSGGLDSTLVLALAAKHAGINPIPTFTLGLPYAGYDEAPAAKLVAEMYGTEHHAETLLPSIERHLPDLVFCLDEPSDPLSVCSYLVSQLAAKHVKVALGGDGGDELFGGYDRYYGNLYAGRLARVPAPLRRAVLGPLVSLVPDGGWYKSKGHQLKWLYRASFEDGGERYARSLGYFYVREDERAELFGPKLREALAAGFDAYEAVAGAYARSPAEHPVDRMLHADSQVRLPDHPVMIQDRASMAHGLEARAPFMDHELAGFCARLPVDAKVRARGLRHLQRRLAERHLPPELLSRPKQGFASALPYLLKHEYAALFDAFLTRSELAAAGYLKQGGIDAFLRAHRAGRADHGQRLWLLLNAEAWFRGRVLGRSADGLRGDVADARASAAKAAA